MTQGEDSASRPDYAGTARFLDPTELRLWTSFLDSGRILDSILERQLLDEHNMSHREYEVLVRLDGAGGRIRMTALARQIEASGPLITQTVERLEGRRWVERRSALEDRRGVEAILLPAGKDALLFAAAPHARLVQQLLTDRVGSISSLDVVAKALGDVADHLRGHRAGSDCDRPDCPLNETA